MQRLAETSVGSKVGGVKAYQVRGDRRDVLVSYVDGGHDTVHPWGQLQSVGKGAQQRRGRVSTRELSVGPVTEPQAIPVSQVLAGKEGVLKVLLEIEKRGYAFVSGLEVTEEFTYRVLRCIGHPKYSIFGDFWKWTVDTTHTEKPLHADTAYTGLPIEPHTDGTYMLDVPALESFHLLEYVGTAPVESFLVDGFAVARDFATRFPDAFELLTRVPLDWCYLDGGKYHLRALAPVITTAADGVTVQQVRWNHYDRGDLRHLLDDTPTLLKVYDAIALWRQELLNSKFVLRYTMVPGTLVIFDNWRALHGRAFFSGKRTLCGCYHDRQVYLSQLSVLGGDSPDDSFGGGL